MSESTSAQATGALQAEIRDLRYHPYEGPRTSGSRAWIIAAAGLRQVTKSKWTKWLAATSLAITAGYGLAMYMAMKVKAVTHGAISPQNMPSDVLKQLLTANRYVADSVLVCTTVLGFFAALIAAGPAIADDLKGGGLHFHFSRPVTTTDYVLGKILPTIIAVWIMALIPALSLGLLRIMLSPSGESVTKPLFVLGKGLLLSVLGAVTMAVPAVAMSALTKRRGVARLLWAALFLLGGAAGGMAVGITHDLRWAVVSISDAVKAIGYGIFGLPWPPNVRHGHHHAEFYAGGSSAWTLGLAVAAIYVLLGLALITWRVSHDRRSGT